MDVFNLLAKLTLDSSEYDKGLSGAEDSAKGFGSKLASGLGTAAKVGGAAIMAVGTAAVATGTAIVKSTGEVAAYGDNIDKMSQKMGISAEAYQEWDAVMQHSGTSMESLKAGMKTLANAVENGNEAFERLGISQEEIANMNQEELFGVTITALQNVENETERTYLAGQLLGRGATELGALLNTSAEETQAMKDRVHELGGVMSDEAVKSAAAYQDTLQDMQTGFESLKRNLVSEFLPGITGVMEGLTSLTQGDYDLGAEQISDGIDRFIEAGMEKIPRVMEIGFKIVSGIGESITKNAPKLLQMGADVLINLIHGLNSELPTLLPVALDAVLLIARAIVDNAPVLLENLLMVFQTVTDFILNDGLPILIEAMPDLLVGIVDFILSGSTMITDAVTQIIFSIIELTPMFVSILAGALPDIISGLVVALMQNAPVLSQAVLKLTIATLLIIPAVIYQILSHIPEIFSAIVDGFKEKWPEMKQAGLDAFKAAIEGMFSNSIVQDLSDGISNLLISGIEKIKEFVEKFKEAGKNIMDGLIGGINDKISEVTNVISGVATTISGGFKKMLGISSPSKLFEEYGGFIDEGLAKGIDEGVSGVDSAMDTLYDSVMNVPKVEGNVGLGLYGNDESGYNNLVGALVSALREVAPELRANFIVEGNADRIVDITVQANREYQRMTGNGLYA